MTPDAVPMPSADAVARDFVTWLEGRGAVVFFRRDDDWQLDLNGIHDMTRDEAAEIAAAALDIRDESRVVLVLRRVLPTVH
jgi:hypothetical protein